MYQYHVGAIDGNRLDAIRIFGIFWNTASLLYISLPGAGTTPPGSLLGQTAGCWHAVGTWAKTTARAAEVQPPNCYRGTARIRAAVFWPVCRPAPHPLCSHEENQTSEKSDGELLWSILNMATANFADWLPTTFWATVIYRYTDTCHINIIINPHQPIIGW